MPKRKRNTNELPPQFARARRRTETPQTEEKAQPKVKEKKRSWFSFGFGKKKAEKAPKKVVKKPEPKPIEKAPKKPKKTKRKSTKKHKGVIAKMAEEEAEKEPKKKAKTKQKSTKKASKKSGKKKATKKAAVKQPKATKKAKASDVHFETMKVHMDDKPKKKAGAAKKKPERLVQKDFVPQLVGDGSQQREEHKSILGIFGSKKEKKPKKAVKVNLEFLSPVATEAEPEPEQEPTSAPKKRSWLSFGFGKKKKASKPEAEPESETSPTRSRTKGGAIASLTARMEGDDEVEDSESDEPQETRAEKRQRLKEEKALLKERKKEEKQTAKQRKEEAKELRKKQQELEAEMDDEEESEEVKVNMKEVDERIAKRQEREEEEKQRREERERRSAQANIDLDATAMRLSKKKKKRGGGISGVLKSINNLGMGKYRAQFIQNMAMMLNAGLPLVDALSTLKLEMKSRAMRKVIDRISELVDSGHPLWRAMEEQYLFSPYEVALIRVGEEAGNLARNAQYLAEQQEKDHALKQKVKMAMIYPTIVFVLMFIVIMGLGLFVLPNLVQVLYSLNAELPAATRAVIWITEMFSTYGTQAVPALLGGMVVLFLLAKYTPLRRVSQWMVFRIPGIGRLAREATIARFGVILGGLLEAGVPLVESIQSLEDVTHIVSYKRMYGKMAERVALGDSFAICFKDIRGSKKMIPASMQQLIITGERSGTLSETFKKVASIYEKKAEETAEKLPTILEPMLLLIIGGLVGTIAFAIITPIYSVVGNVGR